MKHWNFEYNKKKEEMKGNYEILVAKRKDGQVFSVGDFVGKENPSGYKVEIIALDICNDGNDIVATLLCEVGEIEMHINQLNHLK